MKKNDYITQYENLCIEWNKKDSSIKTRNEFYKLAEPIKKQLNEQFISEFKDNITVLTNENNEFNCIIFNVSDLLKTEDNLLYQINHNSFYHSLIHTTNIDNYITWLENRINDEDDYIYKNLNSIKERYIEYLKLLKIKQKNMYVDVYFK